ncbi:2Fe-2S iron-sulfur cluster-binding protein [Pseudohongiella spirulinae]|uniref:CDP-6-deoxy-L-threo-D-glycero-4-hexulose-3-dehydrase reductase n=1 Tax=Pseudohongiella spirulinae TaxID=1249552 RepID=A0A0S2KE81_9GAMM|nr:2Fe-2S iron-sulfur cluster-binding protein [Pseudohongiella spirulinae]ALO46419.1 CDP-6-deoxy-L-threo-D-glycero-4-hexulose-3-dehydrase reductase [Pseudohongiella spirulinae]
MFTVEINDNKTFKAEETQTILDAARAEGIGLEYSCRSGRCGVCRTQVISGTTEAIKPELYMLDEDQSRNWILTCCRVARSDIKLDAIDLGKIGKIKSQTLPCKIDSLVELTKDIVEVTLRLPPTAAFDYVPGQYIDVIGKQGIRRSYSVANAPGDDNRIVLHIRRVGGGAMSQYWFEEAKTDDLLRFEGPLGTFSLRESSKSHLVMLATGTGIAPIKAILEGLDEVGSRQFDRIDVFWGMRFRDEIYWQPSSKHIAVNMIPVISSEMPANMSPKRYVQDMVVSAEIDLSACTVYACGSELMIRDAKVMLCADGLDIRHFHSDAFVSSN